MHSPITISPGGNVTNFEDMSDDEIKAHVAERLHRRCNSQIRKLERELKAARAVVEAARAWVKVAEGQPKSVDEAYDWGNHCMDAATAAKTAIAAYDAATGAKK
jgi:hypothetical protein